MLIPEVQTAFSLLRFSPKRVVFFEYATCQKKGGEESDDADARQDAEHQEHEGLEGETDGEREVVEREERGGPQQVAEASFPSDHEGVDVDVEEEPEHRTPDEQSGEQESRDCRASAEMAVEVDVDPERDDDCEIEEPDLERRDEVLPEPAEEVADRDFDLVVLPGGLPDEASLRLPGKVPGLPLPAGRPGNPDSGRRKMILPDSGLEQTTKILRPRRSAGKW